MGDASSDANHVRRRSAAAGWQLAPSAVVGPGVLRVLRGRGPRRLTAADLATY